MDLVIEPRCQRSPSSMGTPLRNFRVRALSTLDLESSIGPVIPERERWIYRNKRTLLSVMRGLAEANEGQGRVLSFAQYANEE